jgi:hypothetical protein
MPPPEVNAQLVNVAGSTLPFTASNLSCVARLIRLRSGMARIDVINNKEIESNSKRNRGTAGSMIIAARGARPIRKDIQSAVAIKRVVDWLRDDTKGPSPVT